MNYFSANRVFFYILGAITFFLLFYFFFFSPPIDFPVGTVVKIEQGNTLRSVSLKLKNEHIVRSRLALEALVIILGGEKSVIKTDYYFEDKLSVFEVAWRISKGEHRMAPIVIIIPEGFNTIQIANVFASKLTNFDSVKFLLKAKELEGYLFPDTYFFLNTDDEENVLLSMSRNFEKRISPIRSEIALSGKTEKEIIIMASLIEREAKGDTDRGFISGILWKRISIGMPLQVDVAVETYKTKGLPKSPISNPGIESIKAAIHSENSPYFFFIYDRNDNIHYAESFSEHQVNIRKYLK